MINITKLNYRLSNWDQTDWLIYKNDHPDKFKAIHKYLKKEQRTLPPFWSDVKDIYLCKTDSTIDHVFRLNLLKNHNPKEMLPKEFQENKSLALFTVLNKPRFLALLPNWQDDMDVVMAAITRQGACLEHASERLKSHKKIVKAAIKQDPNAFHFAHESCKGDSSLLILAISKDPKILSSLSSEINKKIKNDPHIANVLIKAHPEMIGFFNPHTQTKELVIEVIQKKGLSCVQYISSSLLKDISIHLEILKKNARYFNNKKYNFPKSLLKNEEFLIKAMKIHPFLKKTINTSIFEKEESLLFCIKNGIYLSQKQTNKIQNHPEYILNLIQIEENMIHHISLNKNLVLQLIKLDGELIKIFEKVKIAKSYLEDEEFLREAIKINPLAFNYASAEFKEKNRDLFLCCVKRNQAVFEEDTFFQDDKKILEMVITCMPFLFGSLKEEHKKDELLLLIILLKDPKLFADRVSSNMNSSILMKAFQINPSFLLYMTSFFSNNSDDLIKDLLGIRKINIKPSEEVEKKFYEILYSFLSKENKDRKLNEIYSFIKEHPYLLEMSYDYFAFLKNSSNQTLLHLACGKNDKEMVSLLLSKGYSVSNSDLKNFTPFDLALIYNYTDILEMMANQLKISLSEIYMLKFLGHLFRKRGLSFKGINYEGFNRLQANEYLINYSLKYLNDVSDKKINKEKLKEIISNLSEVDNMSPEKLIEKMQEGEPVVIFTGWYSHIVTVTFWFEKDSGFYFSVNNRGARTSLDGLEIFQVKNSEKLKEVLIGLRETALYSAESCLFLNKFQNLLEANKVDEIKLKTQTSGNCGWANAKAGFLSILYIYFKNQGLSETKAKEKAWLIYKDWSQFVKKTHINDYKINALSPDSSLLEDISQIKV